MSAIDTPLTRDFPSVAHLSRPELEQLVGPFDPARPSVPWYASPATPGAGAGAGAGPSAPPAEEHAFEALVDSLAEVRALRAAIDALTAQSTEKAARNAALQPALEALRLESQALHDRARQLRDEAWPAAQREMNDVRRRFDPPAMLATLGQSAARLHDRSESFASAFVEGLPLDVVAAGHAEVAGTAAGSGAGAGSGTGAGAGAAAGTSNGQEVDAAFVRQYRSMRTVYHKRNIMADRWAKGSVS